MSCAGRPQCAHCGDPDLVKNLTRRPVVWVPAEGARWLAPGADTRETLARYGHLVSPVTG